MIDWQYSESIESPDIVSIKKKYTNYIGGKFVEPKSKKYINTISPSTEELLSKVPLSNEKDINSAVKSAKEGLEGILKEVLERMLRRILCVINVELIDVLLRKEFLEEGLVKEKGVIKEVLLEKLLNNMVVRAWKRWIFVNSSKKAKQQAP